MKKLRLMILPIFVWSGSCMAFHIDDHATIMKQAYSELAACFPQTAALLDISNMVSGDQAEDTDLITKWIEYSHYYNPYKQLQMRRKDSSARIADLLPQLQQINCSSTAPPASASVNDLGHALHHFQDAATPAHATPVAHFMNDGFEVYSFTGDISTGLSCDQIAAIPSSDLETILKETAEQTLDNVGKVSFVVTLVDNGVQSQSTVDGTSFWIQSNDASFGDYGLLGNNFGNTTFSVNGVNYQLPASLAPQFKQQQMRLAVYATLRGLLWEIGN